MAVGVGVEVAIGRVIVADDDDCGGTVGTGVSTGATVGNGASGAGLGVGVAMGLPAPDEDGLEVAVGVGRAATFGDSVGRGSSVAGTAVADGLSSPPGRADSIGPAIPPFSAHAAMTISAVANTTVASPPTSRGSRFTPRFADFHIHRPLHGRLAHNRGGCTNFTSGVGNVIARSPTTWQSAYSAEQPRYPAITELAAVLL
ncbi:MAG: hypothetical protein J4N63_08330, partial [Chloroflexi bacterium]|nr:hypothetical protein [Chloroflexota bacterium]